jgi:hypothetical protein
MERVRIALEAMRDLATSPDEARKMFFALAVGLTAGDRE